MWVNVTHILISAIGKHEKWKEAVDEISIRRGYQMTRTSKSGRNEKREFRDSSNEFRAYK